MVARVVPVAVVARVAPVAVVAVVALVAQATVATDHVVVVIASLCNQVAEPQG